MALLRGMLLLNYLRRLLPVAVVALCGAAPDDGGLAAYWPIDAPARRWTLVQYTAPLRPDAPVMMSVRTQRAGPDAVVLWFGGKPGQAPGAEDGERYHVCNGSVDSWLYLDRYIDRRPGKADQAHPVQADRSLYTADGAAPVDLIATGAYAACGASGQPYLLWQHAPGRYRIQVWGHLVNNPRLVWYWDATVAAPQAVADDCAVPNHRILAMQVREAWWSNFGAAAGKWGLGSGAMRPHDGVPAGTAVRYGRTVWHGQGRMPYVMVGNPAGRPGWCAVPGP